MQDAARQRAGEHSGLSQNAIVRTVVRSVLDTAPQYAAPLASKQRDEYGRVEEKSLVDPMVQAVSSLHGANAVGFGTVSPWSRKPGM